MALTRQLHASALDVLPARERTALCGEMLVGVAHVAVDVDGVITAAPRFFRALAKRARESGIRVSIVTSRSPDPRAVSATRDELCALRVTFDVLHAIPAMGTDDSCPHRGLDWFKRWLFLKLAYCEREGVQLLFDDDAKVIDIAVRFAPTVNVVHVLGDEP